VIYDIFLNVVVVVVKQHPASTASVVPASSVSHSTSNSSTSAHPYKNDNARLVKENNDLHLELLKSREQLDHHIKGSRVLLLSFVDE
jgi:hypothetical protein